MAKAAKMRITSMPTMRFDECAGTYGINGSVSIAINIAFYMSHVYSLFACRHNKSHDMNASHQV